MRKILDFLTIDKTMVALTTKIKNNSCPTWVKAKRKTIANVGQGKTKKKQSWSADLTLSLSLSPTVCLGYF